MIMKTSKISREIREKTGKHGLHSCHGGWKIGKEKQKEGRETSVES